MRLQIAGRLPSCDGAWRQPWAQRVSVSGWVCGLVHFGPDLWFGARGQRLVLGLVCVCVHTYLMRDHGGGKERDSLCPQVLAWTPCRGVVPLPGAPSTCGTSSACLHPGVTLSSFSFPQNVAEYDLKDISYKVRSPTCHELMVLGSSDEPMVFNFEEEREAQKWWTIVSSSLREVQKGQCGQAAARALAGTWGICLLLRGAARLSPAGRQGWDWSCREIPAASVSPSARAASQPSPSLGR